MHVAITGVSGLIGSALKSQLETSGHSVLSIGRSASGPGTLRWDPGSGKMDGEQLEGIDAVVHLAGEGIATRKWSPEQKSRILESRTSGTRLLAETLATLAQKPKVLLSGSAIGFYGDSGAGEVDETAESGTDFLADVTRQWEAAASPASEAGIRVANLRTGIVLSQSGGALGEMLPFFKIGVGGRIGDGSQFWSWVSVTDVVRSIEFLLTSEIFGPVNLTGPKPVTNQEFTKTLGAVLSRPTLLPTPTFALHAKLGKELAEALLFTSANVRPSVLLDHGFEFRHETLESALRDELGK